MPNVGIITAMADMTLEELIALRDRYVKHVLPDSFGLNASTEEKTTTINRAARRLGKRMHLFTPKCDFHLHLNTSEYDPENVGSDTTNDDFSKRIWKFHTITIMGNPLVRGPLECRNGIISYTDFLIWYPTWWDQTNNAPGTPFMFTEVSDRKVILFYAPNAAAVADDDNYASGFYIPDEITVTANLADTFADVPRDAQDGIAIMAGIMDAMPSMQSVEQYNVFKTVAPFEYEVIDEIGRRNKERHQPARSDFQPMFRRRFNV